MHCPLRIDRILGYPVMQIIYKDLFWLPASCGFFFVNQLSYSTTLYIFTKLQHLTDWKDVKYKAMCNKERVKIK